VNVVIWVNGGEKLQKVFCVDKRSKDVIMVMVNLEEERNFKK